MSAERRLSLPARVGPAAALLPLRVFLGVTFVYAGVQKLSDPGYLHPGAPTYIGTQLHSFAHGTPGGFLLRAFALPAPKLTGVATALIEIAIGLLVLSGLLTRAAATIGLLLNLVLFLTNSWKTSPYFLGSDIVFVFAWLPFVLTGASGQPALDNELGRLARLRRDRGRPAARERGSHLGPVAAGAGADMTRRTLVAQALGITALATLALGGVSALAKGRYRGGPQSFAAAPPTTTATPAPAPAQTPAGIPAGAVKLGSSSQLPAGHAGSYNDPRDGQPDIVIRQSDGSLTALSAVCTHQGCTVGYQGGQLVCPCHGGTFNGRTGAVEGGPPPSGLTPRRVVEHAGIIYAIPS